MYPDISFYVAVVKLKKRKNNNTVLTDLFIFVTMVSSTNKKILLDIEENYLSLLDLENGSS